MRIISGLYGGRKFMPPAYIPARPTTDLAKEGLFNTLQNMLDFEHLKTLDLFGGTGNISYELASRGVADLTIVERDHRLIAFIKKTAHTLGISNRMHILKNDVFKYLQQASGCFDFIFADPPYALANSDNLPALIFEKKMLSAHGLLVLEHGAEKDYQQHSCFLRMKNYGETTFTFFKQPR
jgi:16S rRNA (guanine(966)-N(2))-methyltransferase RsmD